VDILSQMASMLNAVQFARGGNGHVRLVEQLKPWAARLSANGIRKWLPRVAMATPCQVPNYENGASVGPCEHHAVDNCIVCGRPVCLDHSFVDSNCDVVCYLCIVQVTNRKHEANTKQAAPKPDPSREKFWAMGVLGVEESDPFETIKSRYKQMSAQYHPDKSQGDEKRFKDVQKAFEILKNLHGA